MITPILTTKLYIPTSRPNIVFRPSLIRKISEGLTQGRKLTLISAPAGYGKTTLIAEWLKTKDSDYAWLSLDAGDNNPQRFFTYLIAALGSRNKEFGHEIGTLLRSPQLPNPETVVTLLLNQIIDQGTPVLLVIDDFHLINNNICIRQLSSLLKIALISFIL